MSETSFTNGALNRRKILKALGIAAFATTGAPVLAGENSKAAKWKNNSVSYYETVEDLRADSSLKENDVVRTLGYHKISDGGHAEYIVKKQQDKSGGAVALKNGLFACLINVSVVNYKMFGTVSDGQNDDGVQIKEAHRFANQHKLSVLNQGGEYWIKGANAIAIQHNVEWGSSIFHIDEKFNTPKASRFNITAAKADSPIQLSAEQKASLLKQLKPGVQVIPELAPYSNCLVFISDKNDQIGFRSGEKFDGQSWAREEFFYVEEHGRIIGEIAWTFKDFTSLIAVPVSDSYLTVSGGAFYLSGDSHGKGYTRNGFNITRSRTIIKNQWVGLEAGKSDIAPNPRSGFYSYSRVFDVTLENVRLIPYEQDRAGTEKDVPAGTYGISAGRMLNGTFRNVTAEGGPVHWGVFGTNLIKNFKIESSKLNRVDVHFHCWNLHIKDTNIGYRGISVTGGGDLIIENTTCSNSSFINFRRDFGAKWDGNIRLLNCRFIPAMARENTVLNFTPMDFNYRYPIGFGRSIFVENLLIDYTGRESDAVCWLVKASDFSKTKDGQRVFFPNFVEFRNVLTIGRDKGVRMIKLTNPKGFDTRKKGSYDGIQLMANSKMQFDNIDLEIFENAGSAGEAHFAFDNKGAELTPDELSLYPEIKFSDCKGLVASFNGNIASLNFSNCLIHKLEGAKKGVMPGKISFSECLFLPMAKTAEQISISVASELGTSFTNCTIHAPKVAGVSKPELADRIGFVRINKAVQFNHLNTSLGRDIINYYKSKGIAFNSQFIAMLRSHHELEPESV